MHILRKSPDLVQVTLRLVIRPMAANTSVED